MQGEARCRTWSGCRPGVWCNVGSVHKVCAELFGRVCLVDTLALAPVAALWAVLSASRACYRPEACSTGSSTPHFDRCRASCGFHLEWA